MDLGTIIGAVATAGLLVGAILVGSSLGGFIDPPSLLIVVLGTMTVGLINYPLDKMISAIKVAMNTLKYEQFDVPSQNELILSLANTARKEGLLALEAEIDNIDDPLLRKGLQLLVDGVEGDFVETVLFDELDAMEGRHKEGAQIFQSLAATAPAMGLIGTLIGLVQMLSNMDDPASIGPAMAVALLTTFYGSLLANIIFTPIATKLQVRHNQEQQAKAAAIRGLMGIAKGVNPRILEQHLEADVPPAQRPSNQGA